MKCVLLGDIGRRNLYHLGDEAMTEIALAMLRERGVAEVTLVATHPDAAQALYGLPSVARIGFEAPWGRSRWEETLEAVTASRDSAGERAMALWDVVGDADLVVIAGGGNMTTSYAHHLYERVALARIARRLGVPLVVTSQTVGPMLADRDRELLGEIVAAASLFGLRDDESHRIVRGLAEGEGSVVRTADDAILVSPSPEAHEVRQRFALPERYIVASFTSDTGTTALDPADYRRIVARLLDELAAGQDAEVVLVPHTGLLEGEPVRGDHESDRAIVAESRGGRVRALPPLRMQEVVDIMATALLSVSTRYHATVFATALGVPALGIALSHYSTVRMTGSLAPFGLARFVIPGDAWEAVAPAAAEVVRWHRDHPDALLSRAARLAAAQRAWWDAVVAVGRGADAPHADIELPPQLVPEGGWQDAVEAAAGPFDRLSQERTLRAWLEAELYDVRGQLARARDSRDAARAALDAVRERAERAESRRVVRIVDALSRPLKRHR